MLRQKIFAMSLAIALVLSLSMSGTAFAVNSQYPKEINGLPVIYVQTSSNTTGLDQGQIRLVLYDSIHNSSEKSIEHLNLGKYLANNPLPKNWTIEVVGGNGTSIESYVESHDKINTWAKQHGPIHLGSYDAGNALLASIHQSFSIVEDTDPSYSQTITRIRGQWEAPSIGGDQYSWSALLVNGVMNSSPRQMVQSGQVYLYDGSGVNVYSGPYWGYDAQYFWNADYIEGHQYWFTIYYSSSLWYMSCEDLDGDGYDYTYDPNASGNHLITDTGTSIFFENYNTNSQWYEDFTDPLAVTAQDYNGSWKNWNYQTIIIFDGYGSQISNNGKITGGLTSGNTAYWNLYLLPLAAYY